MRTDSSTDSPGANPASCMLDALVRYQVSDAVETGHGNSVARPDSETAAEASHGWLIVKV